MLKIKIGDKVKILSGKDKGREGQIEKIFPKKKTVLVPGLNMYKKHIKARDGQKGGIYDLPRPIAVSKLALICPKCKKQTRVAFELKDGKKLRICAKCRNLVDKGKK